MRRFLSPTTDIGAGKTLTLDAEESAHAARVLRLRPGASVRVFDGVGKEFEAELVDVHPKRTTCQVQRQVQPVPETLVEMTLAFGLAKRNTTDWIIQKAVELGAANLKPFISVRSVSREQSDSSARLMRWRRIVRDATKQCGRARLCQIADAVCWEDLLRQRPANVAGVVCWEQTRGAQRLSQTLAQMGLGATSGLWLVIGPEGGFTDEEIAIAKKAGYHVASLGPRILRAETAVAAALAVALQALKEL